MKNDNILVITRSNDYHTRVVMHCLHNHGVDCLAIAAEHLTTQAFTGCTILNGEVSEHAETNGHLVDMSRVGTVWYRRHRNPILPENAVAAEDRLIAEVEVAEYSQCFVRGSLFGARWINDPTSTISANSKLRQLKLALQAELQVPETYIGNSPARVRDFVRGRNCIYKPFSPLTWRELDSEFVLHTSQIDEGDLPCDDVLKVVPGIYQEHIKKRGDIRVMVAGNRVVAIFMSRELNETAKPDIRSVPLGRRRGAVVSLPLELQEKLLKLIGLLGLRFGCIDLLEDDEGRFIFLEVNPMGQFLWMDVVAPEVNALGVFVEFLCNRPSTQAYEFSYQKAVAEMKANGKNDDILRELNAAQTEA
jgi:hypothetical protein